MGIVEFSFLQYDLLPPEEEGDKEEEEEEEDVEDFGSEVREGEEGTRFEGDIAGVFLASLDNFKHNREFLSKLKSATEFLIPRKVDPKES